MDSTGSQLPEWYAIATIGANSCSSITLHYLFTGFSGFNGESHPETAYVRILEAGATPVDSQAPWDQPTTFTAPLHGGNFVIDVANSKGIGNEGFYIDGSATCSTPMGVSTPAG